MLSTAINATCLALMDAGLPLNYVPVSVACAIKEDNSILMDPSEDEEKVKKKKKRGLQ